MYIWHLRNFKLTKVIGLEYSPILKNTTKRPAILGELVNTELPDVCAGF